MKKNLYSLLPLLFSTLVSAHDITLDITGKIIDSTCNIALQDQNKDVAMGDYRVQDLTVINQETDPIAFTIELENCGPDSDDVQITFGGTPAANSPTLLALDASSASATQLAIRLRDKDKQPIALNTAQEEGVIYSLSPAGQSNYSLVFYAQYVVQKTPVPTGSANATASMVLTWP